MPKSGVMVQSWTATHLRMSMYVLTISLHVANVILTHVWCHRIADDPELRVFYPFWTRLFTVWTINMQIFHAAVGYICDKNALNNTKNKYDLNYLRSLNSTFFSAIVWPSSWVCSAIYWFFYNYDRNLLRYNLLKKIMNPLTNHIGHTFILVVVLWELMLRPRREPKSHRRNVTLALSVVGLYIAMMSYTYITAGTWVYPFYEESYGTIYFPLIHLATCLLTVGSYYAQWPISRITLSGTKRFDPSKNSLLLNSNMQKILQ